MPVCRLIWMFRQHSGFVPWVCFFCWKTRVLGSSTTSLGFMMKLLCFQLDQWPRFISARFQYTIYPITFSVGNAEEWKKLFKPCAAQRLFLPVRLQRLHSLTLTLTLVSFFPKQDFFQLAIITFVFIDDFTRLTDVDPNRLWGPVSVIWFSQSFPLFIDYLFPRMFIDTVEQLMVMNRLWSPGLQECL